MESLLGAGAGGLAYTNLAALNSDLAHPANTTASVYNDATPANNGLYVKSGASGTGSWSRMGDLLNGIVRLTVTGGTANAIVTTSPETPSAPGAKLYLMTPGASCSGASTLTVNGAAAVPIKTALASDTVVGSLVANSPVLMAFQVDHYQLMVSLPVDATGVLNDALDARDAAAASAASATASASALGNQAYTFDTGTQAAGATIPTALANIRVIREQAGDALANQVYVPGTAADPGAFAEAGGHYWKPDLSGPPVRSLFGSRAALAAAKVPPLLNAAVCFGYAAAGDCPPFMLTRVTSQPAYGGVRSTDRYLPNGSTDNTNGGWWVYVPGPDGTDVRAFGYKADWVDDTTATDNTSALQAAVNFTGKNFGGGFDVGGGNGGDVVLPTGAAMIASQVIVHSGVRVLGKGTMGTVLKMKDTFSTSSHMFILGTPGDLAAVCASQSRASSGNLVINGTEAAGGVVSFLSKRYITITSAGNDSGRTFTVTGTTGFGTPLSESIAGGNATGVTLNNAFLTVTQVSVNGATAANVTVGHKEAAAFACRLEQLQLFSSLINATSGTAMVYTNKAQHTAGLKNVKIFGGNRHCAFFEIGYGGASYFTLEDVETFNHGNTSGVGSNNSQIKLAYGGLLSPIKNIVLGGPGPAIAGSSAIGIEIMSGFFAGENIHSEHISNAIVIRNPTLFDGCVNMRNVLGGAGTDYLISIDSSVDNNTVLLESVYPNGATVTVRDQPASNNVTGNIVAQVLF
ncbi:hypothetical protein IVA94_18075 [Bradyrhizobium sp. 156]|uniref:hypothetical protein n=1 Tax=Bradyrhizobium sp. 156 TaxID=2782630 RepID=UPI001FFAE830|nr:hypothetical protein [Bradyrhizobium sp. 156]MCK1322768.1 hypothetical protein [Bradyrhizobium sp. 156]